MEQSKGVTPGLRYENGKNYLTKLDQNTKNMQEQTQP